MPARVPGAARRPSPLRNDQEPPRSRAGWARPPAGQPPPRESSLPGAPHKSLARNCHFFSPGRRNTVSTPSGQHIAIARSWKVQKERTWRLQDKKIRQTMVRSGKNGGLHLKQISYYKRTGEYHPTTLASERSGIRRAAKKFVFKENKLFYVGKDRKQMRLVIVSDEEKKRVLHKCHESAAGAHHGISRTLTLVESSYYWTSITNDVKQWVYACQHCQVAKNTAIIVPKLHPIKVEDPWTAVTIDLMGPFNTTCRNHMYVIMMTDLFTKWVVFLPLQDTSAVEIAKAIVSVFFSYGPLKKMVIDQAEEFVHQINRELFALFGMKQIVLSYPQTDDTNERTCKIIKTFLNKYCTDHPNEWDDNLSAIAYAFNLTPMEPVQNTPYFQMFNRNPYVSETSNVLQEAQEDNKCTFAKILEAIKQADRVLGERKATKCQIEKNRIDEQQTGNKVHIKRKPKQINPFNLKVGHEVLRQRKNWWKDGRFQSEWVGPCIIDYITDNGCAILRETTGSRLKRPIKMSHLKPYIRRSNGQDNHYPLQGAIVVDHDYVGLSESSYGPCPQDTIAEGEVNIPAANNLLSPSCKDSEPSECKSQSEFTEDHSILSANSNPEQWSSSCWTLQTKLEDT